jgi:hypothetical protein
VRHRAAVGRSVIRSCLLLAAMCVSVAARAQSDVDTAGRVSARVLPETVTVGQSFVLVVRAIAPTGRQAIAPAVPDTGGMVEPLDPANVTRRGDTLLVRYRLIAWQPGVLTIPLGPVLLRRDSNDVSLPVDARVVVASVLPADTADRLPKDARELFATDAPWWERWWMWGLAFVVGLLTIWLLVRWRRVRRARPAIALTAIARAEDAFARLDARQLTALGEAGRQVVLSAEIVRQYLAEVDRALSQALTNGEVVAASRRVAGVPTVTLSSMLQQVDACRFSGDDIAAPVAQHIGGLAREVVRETERARGSAPERAA